MNRNVISRNVIRVSKINKIKKTSLANKIIEYTDQGKLDYAEELQKLYIKSIREDKTRRQYSSYISITEETTMIIKKYYYNIG